MKRLHTTVLVLLSASLVSAQLQRELPRTDVEPVTVEIFSVESGLATDPGSLIITGTALSTVTNVFVEHEWMPILCQTVSMLEFDCPHPMDPGFYTLELTSPLGPATAVVQFTPTVDLKRQNFGRPADLDQPLADEGLFVEASDPLPVEPWPLVELEIDNGTPGIYYLSASNSLLASPYVLPSIGYEFYLDQSEVIAVGTFPATGSVEVAFEIPGEMFHEVLYFQGLCLQRPPEGSFSWCFTSPVWVGIDK